MGETKRIELFKVYMSRHIGDPLGKTLFSGYIGQGQQVDAFEVELMKFLDREYLLTTCSGTAALDLALHLCGVGPGDEVVTTPITCTATNGVIVRRGARPVWADVEHYTGNIDSWDVAKKITPRTKAIMTVDWGGRPCNYEHLRAIASGIPNIEDAAHAFGADGLGGDYICFSFQAIKHLTTVDGGAIITPRNQYKRAKLLRWYGLDRESSSDFRCSQDITEVGYKYHMNDVCASIGRANLKDISDILQRHRENATFFWEQLKDYQSNDMSLPTPCEASSWWLYTLQVRNRTDFVQHMKDCGVVTSQVHARNDKHTGFCFPNGPLSGVDHFDAHQINIPVGWWLDRQDRDKIVGAVKSWCDGRKS